MKGRSLSGVNRLLAAATLVLAAIAVYCARGLEREHQRAGQAPAATALPAIPEEAATVHPAAAPVAENSSAGTAAAAPSQRDAGDLAVARYRLARLADPQGRAEESRSLSAGLRHDWEELAAFAGLSAEDVEGLVMHEVEGQLQDQRKSYACQADPACQPARPVPPAIEVEQLARLVGPVKAERIQAHRAASEEHQFIRMLRSLPAAADLTDTDAGNLALALAEERRQFAQEAAQGGLRIETQDGPYIGYSMRMAIAPDAADDLQRKLESATQYNARLHARAAAILPAASLARFKAIQDAALDAWRRKVEEMQVARAARRAAGLP